MEVARRNSLQEQTRLRTNVHTFVPGHTTRKPASTHSGSSLFYRDKDKMGEVNSFKDYS